MNNDLLLSPVIIISTNHSNNNNNIVIILNNNYGSNLFQLLTEITCIIQFRLSQGVSSIEGNDFKQLFSDRDHTIKSALISHRVSIIFLERIINKV